MKSMEQVRKEYKQCPKGHGKEQLVFSAEAVYCTECDAHYDLGIKKYK